jgi:hypothetical protein
LIGYKNPIVCPVSAYTGFLVKQILYRDALDENYIDEYELLRNKFLKPEYDLSRFYNDEIKALATRCIEQASTDQKEMLTILYTCGILCLEMFLYMGEGGK